MNLFLFYNKEIFNIENFKKSEFFWIFFYFFKLWLSFKQTEFFDFFVIFLNINRVSKKTIFFGFFLNINRICSDFCWFCGTLKLLYIDWMAYYFRVFNFWVSRFSSISSVVFLYVVRPILIIMSLFIVC